MASLACCLGRHGRAFFDGSKKLKPRSKTLKSVTRGMPRIAHSVTVIRTHEQHVKKKKRSGLRRRLRRARSRSPERPKSLLVAASTRQEKKPVDSVMLSCSDAANNLWEPILQNGSETGSRKCTLRMSTGVELLFDDPQRVYRCSGHALWGVSQPHFIPKTGDCHEDVSILVEGF
jgi:hypothetical protein